jgi:anti-anti-sigma regulatory factor
LKINLVLFYYKCYKKLNCEWNVNVNLNDENDFVNLNKIDKTINLIIIDFTSVEFIDEMAVKCLQNIISLYEKENVRVLFANCNS